MLCVVSANGFASGSLCSFAAGLQIRQAFDVIVRGVAESFAKLCYLFERMQEQRGTEKRIVGFADGGLSQQMEQTAAREDRLLSREFFDLN